MPAITVASRLHTSIRIYGTAEPNAEPPSFVIVGERDPSAVAGWGLTHDVDSDVFDEWLAVNPDMTEFVTLATPEQIGEMSDPANTHGYEIGLEAAAPEPPPTEAPVNVDVPYVEQQGTSLSCTMGNWQGVPDAYAYQWKRDGTTDIGTNAATYAVAPEDIGTTVTCIVTATNAIGSTTAPPSNGVIVT